MVGDRGLRPPVLFSPPRHRLFSIHTFPKSSFRVNSAGWKPVELPWLGGRENRPTMNRWSVFGRPSAISCATACTLSDALRCMPSVDSIQRHPAPEVSRHVEVFAVVDCRLRFVEAAFADDLQRQGHLAGAGSGFA